MDVIYNDCNKVKRSGYYGSKDLEEVVFIIVNDFIRGKVFEKLLGRQGYFFFFKFKINVFDIDYRDFFKWVKERFYEWKGIYEVVEY